jgi:YceI-like domain
VNEANLCNGVSRGVTGSSGLSWRPAEPIAFKVLSNPSRATFKSEAPLETFLGTVAGEGLTGTVTVDPARPQATTGEIKVDLDKVSTGIAKRDADMRGKDFLNTEASEANRYAIFDIKSVEVVTIWWVTRSAWCSSSLMACALARASVKSWSIRQHSQLPGVVRWRGRAVSPPHSRGGGSC